MPLVYNYTSSDGTERTDSYWRVRTVNINEEAKTASFVMVGWANLSAYREGKDEISDSPQEFSIVDPTEYSDRIGTNLRFGSLDEYATIQPFFMQEGASLGESPYSYIEIIDVKVGVDGPSIVDVKWSGVVSAYLALLGVTIKVNGVAGSINPDPTTYSDGYFHIVYTLATPMTLGDEVTFEYDSVNGILTEEGNGYPIITHLPVTAENVLGTLWKFNCAENSAHWAALA